MDTSCGTGTHAHNQDIASSFPWQANAEAPSRFDRKQEWPRWVVCTFQGKHQRTACEEMQTSAPFYELVAGGLCVDCCANTSQDEGEQAWWMYCSVVVVSR